MTFRQTLLLGSAAFFLAGAANAQQRGQARDDLLDAVTRHIQICAEITETQARLACFDRLQTQVGGVQAPAAAASPTPLPAAPMAPQPAPPIASSAPTPAPLQPVPMQPAPMQPAPMQPMPAPGAGSAISSAPLAPQPLAVPGGGVATLDSQAGTTPPPAGSTYDPNAAFDPRSATYRPPDNMNPKPQPQVRRTGQRPIPTASTPQPLVVLGANNLTYGDARYWQVTISLSSNTPRPIQTQAVCTFMNAGRTLEDAYFGPITIQPGEQITTELIGPPTTAYVDSTNCRVLSP